ncbi:MAG: energy-coupled thiamine transporter ThiT [Clostridium sp.]|uniref:energy-coupled thiamine transporter ThiT n=1 Tax=Clostridium sp. TaxID=1506 RepID=UPI003217305D
MEILENIKGILSSWTTIATLVGLLIILGVFMKVKKVKFTSRLIAHIALTVAMCVILEFFKLFQLPFGGSATLGGMLPIILLSLIYGPTIGIFTGFVYGILNFVIGPSYILHPIQVLFDYTLPFMAVGISGFFKNNKYLAIGVGFFGMFIFHYTAGIIFWGSYAVEKGLAPAIYSLIYNGSFILADCIICMAICSVINIDSLKKRLAPYTNN